MIQVLTKFHREVFLRDVARIVGNAFEGLRGEMNAKFDEVNAKFDDVTGHFDAIYQRFDRSRPNTT